MHRWVVWVCLGSVGVAHAQTPSGDVKAAAGESGAAPAPPLPLGHGALPGGLHVPTADLLPRGMFAATALGGFGWRSGLLGDNHRFGRGIGDLAFAYAPHDLLTVAIALDGRYDRHYGVEPSGDDNYVGDPRLIVRLAKAFGTSKIGGQLTLWVPGKDAPSVVAKAISVEGRVVASVKAGPGSVGLSGGFRLDNSDASVNDVGEFVVHEQVSLGISEHHAVVGGAYFTLPTGRMFFGGEASVELYVGGVGDPPGPMLRAGIHGGVHLGDHVSLLVFGEIVQVPEVAAADAMSGEIAVIPYEPAITGGLGLQARFGGGKARRAEKQHVTPNIVQKPVPVIEYAEIVGAVVDDFGKPVAGATVVAKLKHNTARGTTDAKGEYAIAQVPIGKTVDGVTTLDDTAVEVSVEVENKKPSSTTAMLIKGRNNMAKVALDPVLPPGEIRSLITVKGTGQPLPGAKLTLEPGGITAIADASGLAAVAVQPGTYSATWTAQGYKPQTAQVVVKLNDVFVKNIGLSK